MAIKSRSSFDVRKMTYLAILSAIVFVLQIIAIPVGGFFETSALPVAVIVIGSAIFGVSAGAWLGFVFGIAVMILPGTQAYLSFAGNGQALNVFATILIVFLKGIGAGVGAALMYKLLERVNRYFAVIVSGIIAVTVNTGVFILGSVLFFDGNFGTIFSAVIALSYPIEVGTSILLAPVALRVINIKKKPNKIK